MNDLIYETTRRKLVDEVSTSVEKKLFRTYALVGAAVIAGFSYANWDFVEDTKQEAKTAADAAVLAALDETKTKIETQRSLVDVQTGRIKSESDRANKLFKILSAQLGRLDVEASTLVALNDTVDALSESRREMEAGLLEVKNRTESLSVLTVELKRLAEELKRISPESAGTVNNVVSEITNVQAKAVEYTKRPTVYFHFAGGTRTKAKELTANLKEHGFIVPGEQRLASAARLREVRYFFQEDADAANRLAETLTAAIQTVGLPKAPDVKVVNQTNWKFGNPEKGIIEVWMEI